MISYQCRDCDSKRRWYSIGAIIEHRTIKHPHLYLYDFRKVEKKVRL